MIVKTQIYEIQTPEEAQLCADLGVNFIGVVTGTPNQSGTNVDLATCRSIFAATPAHVTTNALTISPHVSDMLAAIQATRPDVLHLSGKIDEITPENVATVKRAEPFVKIMVAIPVGGPDTRQMCLDYAREFSHVADYFILDTMRENTFDEIGATGETHDWNISAEIVRTVNVPVIHAGGLSPDNVAEAVRQVRPFGVDSFTHTNLEGSLLKDPAKVKAFVQNAITAL